MWTFGWAIYANLAFIRESYISERDTHPGTNKVKFGFPSVIFAHGWSFLGNYCNIGDQGKKSCILRPPDCTNSIDFTRLFFFIEV